MSLTFIDGYDHYATAHIARKYESVDAGNFIDPTGGKYGGGALMGSSAALNGVVKIVTPATPLAGVCGYWMFGGSLTPASSGFYTEFNVMSGLTTILLAFVVNDSANGNGTITVKRGGYFGTVLGTTSLPLVVSGAWVFLEFRWALSATIGQVEIRANDVTQLSLASVNTGATAWNGINLLPGGTERIDDIYLLDQAGAYNNTFLGRKRIRTFYPDAAGASSGWTGAFGTVDDHPPNDDTDYLASRVAGVRTTVSLETMPAMTGIAGVQLNQQMRRVSSAVASSVAPVIRLDGADNVAASQAITTNGYANYRQLWERRPDTGAVFTTADLNAGEVGIDRAA